VINASRLARGWLVGRLLLRERRWVHMLLDAPAERRLTPALKNRLGPPLVHPLDPRHDYIEQERLLWEEPRAAARCGEVPTDYGASLDDVALPHAAETRDDYR
ncbi:MAG: hypothetical protein RBS99_16320, partial [Rhodospirillales bacterium]|nr:hypothetical protein [Rhodospirillales bacterium]